ncbi:MAG: aspartate aminotransferase family protein [Candidatus Pacebacteria bacterium]|nr:aspartate aminotransferase family protein [Candidatus Paceibacterota bacterium]
MKNIAKLHQHFLLNTYPFRGKVFSRGEGNYLIDDKNQKYLDVMINYGVNIFGYDHPELNSAIKNQVDSLLNLHCSFANEVRAEAAQKLIKRSGGKLKKVYFANSGAEAIEAAIKFALLYSERKEIISMEGGFHGKTLAALSVTNNSKYRNGLTSSLMNISFAQFNNIESLRSLISEETAAVILEPIQGESGIIVPDGNYLSEVSALCEETNTLLILDEIQTGAGRTGTFLAFQGMSSDENIIQPDIVCLGKGIAGGIPSGVVLMSKAVAEHVNKAMQTSTFGGNPLSCAGIKTILDLITDDQLESVSELGEYFINQLQQIDSELIVEVRGKGLMIGVEMDSNQVDRDQILKSLQKEFILASPAGDNVVRFLPPYTITKEEINQIILTLKNVLEKERNQNHV